MVLSIVIFDRFYPFLDISWSDHHVLNMRLAVQFTDLDLKNESGVLEGTQFPLTLIGGWAGII